MKYMVQSRKEQPVDLLTQFFPMPMVPQHILRSLVGLSLRTANGVKKPGRKNQVIQVSILAPQQA